jgi:hypothetical protein
MRRFCQKPLCVPDYAAAGAAKPENVIAGHPESTELDPNSDDKRAGQ